MRTVHVSQLGAERFLLVLEILLPLIGRYIACGTRETTLPYNSI